MSKKIAMIIDGNPMAIRAFYKLDLRDQSGRSTSSIYGTLSILSSLIKKIEPDVAVVCWDKGKSKKRLEIYPKYKMNRIPSNETETLIKQDMWRQFGVIKKMFLYLAIPQISFSGYEADELIYASWKIFRDNDYAVVVVTMDTDMLQLVDDYTIWYNPVKDKSIDKDNFLSEVGVERNKYVLYKSIVGDGSDDIDGINGMGHKRTSDVLQKYHTLNQICLGDDKYANKIKDDRAIVERNLKLINLSFFSFIIPSVFEMMIDKIEINRESLTQIFIDYDLQKFLKDFSSIVLLYANMLSKNRECFGLLKEVEDADI